MNREHSARTSIAAKLLDMAENDAKAHSRRLPDLDADYFWKPVRGGGSLIVARDGSVLYANSSVPFDVHVDAFKSGRRTDPADFQPKS